MVSNVANYIYSKDHNYQFIEENHKFWYFLFENLCGVDVIEQSFRHVRFIANERTMKQLRYLEEDCDMGSLLVGPPINPDVPTAYFFVIENLDDEYDIRFVKGTVQQEKTYLSKNPIENFREAQFDLCEVLESIEFPGELSNGGEQYKIDHVDDIFDILDDNGDIIKKAIY